MQSIITPVSMSRDLSEIILICLFAAQNTFIIDINVENSCAVLVETMILLQFERTAFI